MKKISMSPEALAALNAEGANIKAPSKPLPAKAVRVIHKRVAKALFGPSMVPTIKMRLLLWSSHAAIKASWAADHFQRMWEEKHGLRRGSLRMNHT